MNEAQLKEIILKAVTEAVAREGAAGPAVDPGEVPDLSAVDYRKIIDVPNPANEEEYRLLRSRHIGKIQKQKRCLRLPFSPLPVCGISRGPCRHGTGRKPGAELRKGCIFCDVSGLKPPGGPAVSSLRDCLCSYGA